MTYMFFRGQRIHDNKWIYGNLIKDRGGEYHIINHNDIEKGDIVGLRIYSNNIGSIKQETIGQFSTRQDKNDNMIYAGDICEVIFYEKTKQVKHILVVEFDDCEFGMYDKFKNKHCSLRDITTQCIEIIGNTYDNPELLQEDK